jgi:hypothetical protein
MSLWQNARKDELLSCLSDETRKLQLASMFESVKNYSLQQDA